MELQELAGLADEGVGSAASSCVGCVRSEAAGLVWGPAAVSMSALVSSGAVLALCTTSVQC
jgi:hypothetical protein